MPKSRKLDRVFIPDAARQPKPNFSTRDAADKAAQEIKDHIRQGHPPYLWWGHTHNKPPPDSPPAYIGEFELPPNQLTPCPCCSPEYEKFGAGKIAWFYEENVIRIIGPECFRSLNKDAHDIAIENYRREREDRLETDYLMSRLTYLSQDLIRLENILPTMQALIRFHEMLHFRLKKLGLNLWPHVKDAGGLSVSFLEYVPRRQPDGSIVQREQESTRVAYRLPGYRMLDPAAVQTVKQLPALVEKIRISLREVPTPSLIAATDFKKKRQIARILRNSRTEAREIIEHIMDLQKFFAVGSINTLRAWGRDQGCPIEASFERIEFNFIVSTKGGRQEQVTITPECTVRIENIEK